MKKPTQSTPAIPPELASRAAALEALQSVLHRRQPLDETLDGMWREPQSTHVNDKRDRGFVHLLVATTLRRLGQLDAVIKACLDKPQELKSGTQDLLRLGAAQLLFLRTPPHAAVDTIVELAASDNATAPYKGLINAVLRRLTREGDALIAAQDAARLNAPDWLWLSWRQNYGVAQARAIAIAHLGEALTDITVKSDPSGWAEKLKARLLPNESLRLNGDQPITTLSGFSEGDWWVQDAAASMPARLLGDVRRKTVIDLCAAPGGKTAQLAAAGANVIAVDRSEKRLQRLRENLARLHLEAEIICADALKFTPKEPAPFVLLDAPCSATGTARRHPDVPHLKTPEDVARMTELQGKLLLHAFDHLLAPGGTLIYTVCSLQPEEAERRITAFLDQRPNAKRRPITAAEAGNTAAFITPSEDLRCLPCHWPEYGGLDGFFAGRIEKTLK